jgi:hypothetical protein
VTILIFLVKRNWLVVPDSDGWVNLQSETTGRGAINKILGSVSFSEGVI